MPIGSGSKDRYALAAQEDRSAPRTRLSIPATLRPSGTRGFQTVVNDLSLSGFSALAINRIHPKTLCWLTLPNMESLEGHVVWWDNGLVGCAFHRLLNPIIFEAIIDRWTGAPVYRAAP